MNSGSDSETRDTFAHVLLPVANEGGALATATALEPYRPNRVTALRVVEKGEGVPDKTPVEQSEGSAADSNAAVRTVFTDADEAGASAIGYRSRGGNRIMQCPSGDLSSKLVTNADRPVIALPRANADS